MGAGPLGFAEMPYRPIALLLENISPPCVRNDLNATSPIGLGYRMERWIGMTTAGPEPEGSLEGDRDARVICPWCRRDDTERLSLWGPFLSVAHYYCRTCRTVFDVVRDDENPGDEG
jgi:hypothetical protein